MDAGGRALIQLDRELRKSGSDIVVEEDLADVFGRNRIQEQFESSFRTAVRDSTIVPIPSLVDIVLEAGAGPTVRRSLKNRASLSSVIQLSLLGYTHVLYPLTKALIQALEQRAKGSSDSYAGVPNHDTLLGTLGAIRDQSAGYKWDLVFSAVETQLHSGQDQHVDVHDLRRLPFVVLQALLDTFTATQRFPEQRLLWIRASSGVSTIVVWAYHVLGLTTNVFSNGRTIAHFGNGMEQVLIEWHDSDTGSDFDSVTLMSASDNESPDFHLVADPLEDVLLEAFCRHEVLGYGTRVLLNEDVHSNALQRDLAHVTLAWCIRLARQKEEEQDRANLPTLGDLVPSANKLLLVGDILFPNLLGSHTAVEDLSNLSCWDNFCWRAEDLPQDIIQTQNLRLYEEHRPKRRGKEFTVVSQSVPTAAHALNLKGDWKRVVAPAKFLLPVIAGLSRLKLALATIADVSDCKTMPLDLASPPSSWPLVVKVMAPRSGFEYLARLLYGRCFTSEATLSTAALVSQMGWSIMFGSLQGVGPTDVEAGLIVHRGVPARKGERANWILDLLAIGGELVINGPEAGHYQFDKQAGEQVKATCTSKVKTKKSLIGFNHGAFEVVHRFEILQRDQPHKLLGHVKTGLREYNDWRGTRSGFLGALTEPDPARMSKFRTRALLAATLGPSVIMHNRRIRPGEILNSVSISH